MNLTQDAGEWVDSESLLFHYESFYFDRFSLVLLFFGAFNRHRSLVNGGFCCVHSRFFVGKRLPRQYIYSDGMVMVIN